MHTFITDIWGVWRFSCRVFDLRYKGHWFEAHLSHFTALCFWARHFICLELVQPKRQENIPTWLKIVWPHIHYGIWPKLFLNRNRETGHNNNLIHLNISVFIAWMVIGLIGAFLFVIIQLILIIDFAHGWSESWVEKYEETEAKCWYFGKLVCLFTTLSWQWKGNRVTTLLYPRNIC